MLPQQATGYQESASTGLGATRAVATSNGASGDAAAQPSNVMNARRFIAAIIRSPRPPPFAERDVMEYSRPGSRGSLPIDAGGLDHLGPLVSFLGDELAKI